MIRLQKLRRARKRMSHLPIEEGEKHLAGEQLRQQTAMRLAEARSEMRAAHAARGQPSPLGQHLRTGHGRGLATLAMATALAFTPHRR